MRWAWGTAALALVGFLAVACGDADVPDHCFDDEWGAAGELPDRVFVATWGRADGAGTREDPLDTIQGGLDLAAAQGKQGVAVSGQDGGSVYPEGVIFEPQHSGLSLQGRCAERVTIGGLGSDVGVSVLVRAGEVDLADLTFEGARWGLLISCVYPDEVVPVVVGSRLIIRDNGVAGASVIGDDCEPSLTLSHTRIESNDRVGLSAAEDADLYAIDCVLSDNGDGNEEGYLAAGVDIASGASAVLTRTTVSGSRGYGIFVHEQGTELELVGSVISETTPFYQQDGTGLVVFQGSTATATDVVIDQPTSSGVWAYGYGTTVILDRTQIRDVAEHEGRGRGIGAGFYAQVYVYDGQIEGTTESSILADEARVEVERAELRDNRGSGTDTVGGALTAVRGGHIKASGVSISDVGFAGVLAADGGARVELDGVSIDGVRGGGASEDYAVARGIYVEAEGLIQADDVQIRRVDGTGALVTGELATLLFDGLEVEESGLAETGGEGYGLAVGDYGRADGSELTIRGSARRSLRVTGAQARGVVDGGTLGPAAGPDCAAQLLVTDGGELELTSVDVPTPCMGSLHTTGGAHVNTADSRFGAGSLFGIAVADGARLEDVASTIEATSGVALIGMGKDTSLSLLDTRIEGPPSDAAGRGIDLARGAGLVATGLVVEGTGQTGLLLDGAGTHALLRESRIAATRSGGFVGAGLGVAVQGGALVNARGTVVQDGAGPGVLVQGGGVLVGHDMRLEGNTFSGALALAGGVLDLTRGTIRANAKHGGDGGGFGVYAAATELPVWLRLRDVELRDQPSTALHLVGAGSFSVQGGSITGNPEHTWLPDGVLLADQPIAGSHPETGHGNLGLQVRDVAFRDMDLAFLLNAATAVVDGCSFEQVEEVFWVEACGDVPPPVLDGVSTTTGSCGQPPRPVTPLDFYVLGDVGLQPLDSTGVSEPFSVPGLLDSLPAVEQPCTPQS